MGGYFYPSKRTCAFLYDGKGQQRASFECGAIFGKNLNPGIKGDQVSKIAVFGHFLRNLSLKVSNFLHDGRGQQKDSDNDRNVKHIIYEFDTPIKTKILKIFNPILDWGGIFTPPNELSQITKKSFICD